MSTRASTPLGIDPKSSTHQPSADTGSGVISTSLGIAVFLITLLLVVQVAIGLYTKSTATSLVYDTARRIATSGSANDPAFVESQRRAAETALRRFDPRASVVVETAPAGYVLLHIDVRAPTLFGHAFSGLGAATGLQRSFLVRIEQVQR